MKKTKTTNFRLAAFLLVVLTQLFLLNGAVFAVVSAGQLKVSSITPQDSLLPMIGGLLGVLAVIFVLAFLLRKMTGLNLVSNNIKVIESQNLGTKEKLVIVEIQNKQYVLGVTAHSINQVCELSEIITKPKTNISFDAMLKQLTSFSKVTAAKPARKHSTDSAGER